MPNHGSESKQDTKRATIYFEPELHRALRVKAAESDTTISRLVNEAVQLALAEDAEDLAAFAERVDEPTISYEELVSDLRQRGRI